MDDEPLEEGVLSPSEIVRVTALLAAAEAGNWERFKAVPDVPFGNVRSMREQFDNSSIKIDYANVSLPLNGFVRVNSDGTRLLNFELPNIDVAGRSIRMFLVSKFLDDGLRLQLLTFYEEISFS